ncbi:uncharacterized protein METZ01_LOCUS327240, partial [marine metagenome]
VNYIAIPFPRNNDSRHSRSLAVKPPQNPGSKGKYEPYILRGV